LVAEKPKSTLSPARSKVCAGGGSKAKNRRAEDKSPKETNLRATRKSLRKSTRSEKEGRSYNRYRHAGEKEDSQGTNLEGEMGHKKSEIGRMGEKIQVTIPRIKASTLVDRLRRNELPQLAATA